MNDDRPDADQAQSDNNLPPDNPVVPANGAEDDQVRPKGHHQDADSHQERWPNRVMALMTIGLVCITGFYTHFARQQVIETRNMLALTSETMRLERRAWVGPTGRIDGRVDPVDQTRMRYDVYISNTGFTPALDTTFQIGTRIRGTELGPVFDIPPLPDDVGRAVVFPGSTMTSVIRTPPLTDAVRQGLQDEARKLYIVGRVSYEDIFGDPHTTEYCLVANRDLTSGAFCSDFNTAN